MKPPFQKCANKYIPTKFSVFRQRQRNFPLPRNLGKYFSAFIVGIPSQLSPWLTRAHRRYPRAVEGGWKQFCRAIKLYGAFASTGPLPLMSVPMATRSDPWIRRPRELHLLLFFWNRSFPLARELSRPLFHSRKPRALSRRVRMQPFRRARRPIFQRSNSPFALVSFFFFRDGIEAIHQVSSWIFATIIKRCVLLEHSQVETIWFNIMKLIVLS